MPATCHHHTAQLGGPKAEGVWGPMMVLKDTSLTRRDKRNILTIGHSTTKLKRVPTADRMPNLMSHS